MVKLQDIDIPYLEFAEASAPSTPASGILRVYAKTDSKLYQKDDAGTETDLASAGGASLGAWTSYTPTWTASTTNPTLGNGTLAGYYKALDASTYLVEISLILGSTTNIGSGTYSFALPATAAAAPLRQVLAGYFLDAGTAFYVASGQIVASTATVALVVIADSTGTRIWTSGNPNVLTQDDELVLSGILKV